MARLLTRHGNKVGAMIFSRTVEDVLPPRGGQNQILRIVHQLIRPERQAAAEAARLRNAKKKRNEADREAVTDLKGILDRAGETLKRRSMVFIVSDFISSEGWEIPLARMAQRHEVVAVLAERPARRRAAAPSARWCWRTPRPASRSTSTRATRVSRSASPQLVAERRASLEHTFARFGVDVIRLTTDTDLVQTLVRFAHLRKETGAQRW